MVLPPLTRIDHVGIACRDLDRAVALYQATFGLEVASLEVNEEQGVREAMLRVGASAVSVAGVRPGYVRRMAEKRQGHCPGCPHDVIDPRDLKYYQNVCGHWFHPEDDRFARRGEGIHHVGYRVEDIREALATVAGTGIRLVDDRPRHGSMGASIAFLHPGDLGGVLTELVQPLS